MLNIVSTAFVLWRISVRFMEFLKDQIAPNFLFIEFNVQDAVGRVGLGISED